MSNICRSKSIVLRCTAWTLDGLKEALEKALQGELSIAKLEKAQVSLSTDVCNISKSVTSLKEFSEETKRELPTSIHDTIKGSSELQELIRGKAGHTPNIRWVGTSLLIDDLQAVNLKGEPGVNPKPSEVAELIAGSKQYKDRITQGLATEEKVKEIARSLDSEIKVGGRNLILDSGRKVSNTSYVPAEYHITTPSEMKHGDTYSIRIWGTMDREITPLRLNNSGGYVMLTYTAYNAKEGTWDATFKWDDRHPTHPGNNTYIRIYADAQRQSGVKTFTTTIERTMLVKGNVLPQSWTPAPEDIDSALATRADTATTTAIAKELGEHKAELVTLSTRVRREEERAKAHTSAIRKYATELGNSQTIIQKLEKLTSQLKEGKLDSDSLPNHLKWLLDALNNGETTLEGGLMLTKIIGLSNHEGKITAYLSGYNEGGGKVLRAGIGLQTNTKKSSVIDYLKSLGFTNTDEIVYATTAGNELAFTWLLNWAKKQPIPCDLLHKQYNLGLVDFPESFKPTTQVTYREHIDLGTEEVAIYHDGRGHFGDIYLNRDIIDFKRSETAKPYLSVGQTDAEFIDDFLKKARTDTTPINEGSINLNNSNRAVSYTHLRAHET